MNRGTVTVTANPNTGEIFTLSLDDNGQPKKDKNGKEFGFIRVEEHEVSLGFAHNSGGVKRKSALVTMTREAWNGVSKYYKDGMEVKGRVRTLETVNPEEGKGWQPKTAGKDGQQLTSNGKPIFFKTEYTEDINLADIRVSQDPIKESVVSASQEEILNGK